MKDKYIVVMLQGTQNAATGEYIEIPLYVKAGDVAEVEGFSQQDISGIEETPDENYINVSVIAVWEPEAEVFKLVKLYALFTEWLKLTITASEYITGVWTEEGADNERN